MLKNKKDLIKGKYYKHTDEDNDSWLFCFDGICEFSDNIKISGYVIFNNILYINKELSFYVNDLFEEIGFDEIKIFLPKNHPDIIVNRKLQIKKLLTCLSKIKVVNL